LSGGKFDDIMLVECTLSINHTNTYILPNPVTYRNYYISSFYQ